MISTLTLALSQVAKLQIQFPESRLKLRVRFPAEMNLLEEIIALLSE